MMSNKIILAYSGGLDTSCSIKWLQEQYGYEVIAVTVDVGEEKDLQQIHDKALKVGAKACHVIDLKDTFANDYITQAIMANALYENTYPLISALSRPLIAKTLVDIAKQEKAVALAHGCTGKGNDQVRFDLAINALAPQLKVVAPAREYPLSREQAIAYAIKNNIPLPIDLNNPFSIDQNLWGKSCECGVLEDPWVAPPEEAYSLTNALSNTPDTPLEIILGFNNGIPISLNNEVKPLAAIIKELNQMAGKHGIGRIDHIENRLVGIKSREVYEAPAAMTIITAHRALEAITLVREVAHVKPLLEMQLAKLIYEGLWFSPLRDALLAFIKETQTVVTGDVRIKLFKGHAVVTGRQSPYSLYNKGLATYADDDQFDHQAALGFIKLWGLPTGLFHSIHHGGASGND
jgi:argininosuccinate synthase